MSQDGLYAADRRFVAYVRANAHIGYGRMLQLIQREWMRQAANPGDAHMVRGCVGLLARPRYREELRGAIEDAAFEGDPLPSWASEQ